MKALPFWFWTLGLILTLGLIPGRAAEPAPGQDSDSVPATPPGEESVSAEGEPGDEAEEIHGTAPDEPQENGQAPAESNGTAASESIDRAAAAPPETAGTRPAAGTASATRGPAEGEKSLRLNFRGVPLDMVLNYLSDAAGFIINLETEVKGRVDVWSNQPLNRDEAVGLLNTVLNRNGYAALRNGRTLTIVSRDEAKKRDVPVVAGSNPEEIPKGDEILTQIIPVRFISAVQLVKDLQALLPATATLTANEGGNALILTDTQSNIRRMAEIVQALDTAIASVSSVRVFALRYADAKAVATVIKDLFAAQDASRTAGNQGGPGRFFAQFRGGGPGGAAPGGGDAASANGGRAPTPRVTAVADERSNSVVVSAPEEQMAVIDGVIEQIDGSVEDITELRVFRLRFADPQETADLLSDLFSGSQSQQATGPGTQVRFGGAFGGRFGGAGGMNAGGRGAAAAGLDTSARLQKQTRVVAVPDLRTGSVVVSASRDLMDQIARMLEQLDADPARKQKVFVYSVENTDPQAIQDVLQTLFPEQNTGVNRNTRNTQRQNNNQLNNRQTQNRNQGNRSNTGFGTGTANNFGTTGGNR